MLFPPFLPMLFVLMSNIGLSRCQLENRGIISINSPRSNNNNNNDNNKDNNNKDKSDHVLVKLPDDLEAVLNLQKSDRSRHASILGLNPGNQHLDQILMSDITTTTSFPTTPTPLMTEETSTPTSPTTITSSTLRSLNSFNQVRKSEPNNNNIPDREEVQRSRSFWAIAWEAHIYFSGTLFVLLSIYCFVNILRLHTFSRLFSRGYFVALNLCLILIGVLRPIYLFHDPYNSENTFPRLAGYLLLDTGLPCISTAFAVLFLALLRSTQIELVSPDFQTPKSLGIFCLVHFAISIGVDIAIGLEVEVRYLILLCQGFFIVWSLLLSAGYFYIFSAMKKIAMRTRDDFMRQMCPKLALDPTNSFPGHQTTNHLSVSDSTANPQSRPPLARAVHLTLGVAILGSLMGGVQLFGMIKMLGLQKDDMSTRHNEMAWFGYQVSMRILEVTICTLLAVIATTPLRSDIAPNLSSPQSSLRRRKKTPTQVLKSVFCCCCYNDSNPPIEFEDEIYSEICSTNRSVRQIHLQGQNGSAYLQQQQQYPDQGLNNPYGTLGGRMSTLQHQQPQAMRMGPINDAINNGMLMIGGPNGEPTRSGNSEFGGAGGSSSSNPNSTLRSGQLQDANRTSVASSRATLDTALYSNLRSRPSSMLFNDSGFVRFRANGDPNLNQEEILKQSSHDLTDFGLEIQQQLQSHDPKFLDTKTGMLKAKEGQLRASQSFDDSVLLMDHHLQRLSSPDKLSPSSQPEQTFADRLQQVSPIYKSLEEEQQQHVLSQQQQEAIYEPPPGMFLPKIPQQNPYSANDSDLESTIYNRPPSRCSSVSATQSFDMRMYGRTKPNTVGGTQTLNTRDLQQPQQKPKKEKLENPFYYYGSTRKQRPQHQVPQKPRPLLPSQRAQLEAQTRGNNHLLQSTTNSNSNTTTNSSSNSRPNSRQALLGADSDPFVRSRSLGGYYNNSNKPIQNGVVIQDGGVPPPPPPPLRNQLFRSGNQAMAGSMTPLSYSRWQHAQRQEAAPKRYNPLYDTPPTARHAHSIQARAQLRLEPGQGQGPGNNFRLMESPRNFSSQQRNSVPQPLRNQQQFLPSEIRGMFRPQQPQPSPQQQQLVRGNNDHILSPVSVASSHQGYDAEVEEDDDDSDVASNFDPQFESHPGGFGPVPVFQRPGYNDDGLADNESEISSVAGGAKKNAVTKNGANSNKVVSPLEYSAMLKLYSQDKDVEFNDPSNSNFNSISQLGPSNSSSESESWESKNKKTKKPPQNSDYRRVSSTADEEIIGPNNELFSQSSSSGSSSGGDETDSEGKSKTPGLSLSGKSSENKRYQPVPAPREVTSAALAPNLAPTSSSNMFRWDGSRISKEEN